MEAGDSVKPQGEKGVGVFQCVLLCLGTWNQRLGSWDKALGTPKSSGSSKLNC